MVRLLIFIGIFISSALYAMEGTSTASTALESPEIQVRRLKEGNRDIIDIGPYMEGIKATLPDVIRKRQEALTLQGLQTLPKDEKQVNSLFGKFPAKASASKIYEKAGQLKSLLQGLHLHNQSGNILKAAAIYNSGAIEAAQRPFLVIKHAHAAILSKHGTQTQFSSIFTDCATTAGGDIGYFAVDGKIYELLFHDQICCSKPETRAYTHYDQEKVTDIALLEKALMKFRDCPEVTCCHFNRLSNNLQIRRYFALKKMLVLLSGLNEKNSAVDMESDLKGADYRHYQQQEMHQIAGNFLSKHNLDGVFAPLKSVVSLAENICNASDIYQDNKRQSVPLLDMITLQSYLQSGLAVLYAPDRCSGYEDLYQKAYKQLKGILNSTNNAKLKKNGLDSLIAGMHLPPKLSYKDAILREGIIDNNGFPCSETWRTLYESNPLELYPILLKLNRNKRFKIQPSVKVISSAAVTKEATDSDALLEKLTQDEEIRKEREKQTLSKNARRREQRRKNKEKVDNHFDPAKLEEAIEAHRTALMSAQKNAEIAVTVDKPSASVPSTSGSEQLSSVPKVCYSRTLNQWFTGEFDGTSSEGDIQYHVKGQKADEHVLVHGHQSKEKCPRGVNTVYEMPGEMHYVGGNIEQVMFRLIESSDGIIFHREVKPLKDLSKLREFSQSAYELHYPALGEKSNPMLDEIHKAESSEIKENQFCIYITPKDRAEPTIILYKPHDA